MSEKREISKKILFLSIVLLTALMSYMSFCLFKQNTENLQTPVSTDVEFLNYSNENENNLDISQTGQISSLNQSRTSEINQETENLENMNVSNSSIVETQPFTGPRHTIYAYYSNDKVNYYYGTVGGTVCFAESTATNYVGSWSSSATYYGNYPNYFYACAQQNSDQYRFYGFISSTQINSSGRPTCELVPRSYQSIYSGGPYPYNLHAINNNGDYTGETFYATFININANPDPDPDPDPDPEYSGIFDVEMDSGVDHISVSVDGGTAYNYYSYYSNTFDAGHYITITIYTKPYNYMNDVTWWGASGYFSWEFTGLVGSLWLTDGGTTGEDGGISIHTISEPQEVTVRYACYQQNGDGSLSMPCYAGTIKDSVSASWANYDISHEMYSNQVMTLFAKPNDGCEFIGWYKSTDVNSYGTLWKTASEATVYTNVSGETFYYINSDYKTTSFLAYYAIFAMQYKVTIETDIGVSISCGTSASPATYELFFMAGDKLCTTPSSGISIFNVTMDNGYGWDNWELLEGETPQGFILSSVTQSADLIMPGQNIKLRAKSSDYSFGIMLYAVSSMNDGTYVFDGSLVVGGTVKFDPGVEGASALGYATPYEYFSCMAIPKEGYAFVGWSASTPTSTDYGTIISDQTTYTDCMLPGGEAGTIKLYYYAIFCKTYTLTIQKSTGITDCRESGNFYYGQELLLWADVD
ncbi:MAG: hypothetical protein PHR96_04620, partial [Clostridia bacterium]|nr:hypothetical protein [Clostridia bacterium]